ncbi:hypothetical protein [Candidatus Amarobacter glycogenicus]|uniref:hypothetical protein n=1 Tax=Candidatus Amarobacter glycogenicus TaxID=3140699 RepID=UPI002A0FFD16|nr:hypothetical protein [Dehalococcoidia bacterium]
MDRRFWSLKMMQMLAWTQGLLEDEGYDVLVAIDDGAGLKTGPVRKPDLILLDIFCPAWTAKKSPAI